MSEPEPDLVLLKPRLDFYRNEWASAADTLLVIEVSDSTLRYHDGAPADRDGAFLARRYRRPFGSVRGLGSSAYQIETRRSFGRASFAFAGTPNASYHSATFGTTPFTRNSAGLCGSEST